MFFAFAVYVRLTGGHNKQGDGDGEISNEASQSEQAEK